MFIIIGNYVSIETEEYSTIFRKKSVVVALAWTSLGPIDVQFFHKFSLVFNQYKTWMLNMDPKEVIMLWFSLPKEFTIFQVYLLDLSLL